MTVGQMTPISHGIISDPRYAHQMFILDTYHFALMSVQPAISVFMVTNEEKSAGLASLTRN
jgi:hypothetical protein